jgi:ATP-dependent Lon protease
LLDDETINKIFNLEEDNTIDVDLDIVHKYLDKPTHTNELIHTINSVGIVNGLYATSIGIGGIVPIQIYKNYICKPNHNTYPKLKITGNQKQIMKESVLCALTVAINIVNDTIKAKISTCYQNGFHIHAPDGGTPKDGPSAGCAFATAFVSLLLEKKINRYVSMTGEIDLTGKICKIGGLNAKLNGAKKAGIRTVYISEENQTDYEMIKQKNPELFDNSFNVVIVKHIIDIVTNPEVILDIDLSNDFDQSFIKKLD